MVPRLVDALGTSPYGFVVPIDRALLEEVHRRVDILDVVGRVTSLRKQGSRYVGLCPFHEEKTPSFSVSPDKGLYYCFGCHAGGDVIDFVRRHGGLDFREAVRQLAEAAGLAIESESPADRSRRESEARLVEVQEIAQAFFAEALWGPKGAAARRYLRERGVPETQARARGLGFGGRRGELLCHLRRKGISQSDVAQAGLTNEHGSRGLFDGRITFPIRDERGRLAGFGARSLDERPGPKYLNSRESPIFSKGRLLYGWPEARSTAMRRRRIVFVEGYFDVLACERDGLSEAVAALGTSLTVHHARLCRRIAQRAVLLLDSDAAGEEASRKAAIVLLREGFQVLLASIPPGRDPDALLRERGQGSLRAAVERAQPVTEVLVRRALAGDAPLEAKASRVRDLAPILEALGESLEKDLYVARLAEGLNLTPEKLRHHLREPRPDERAHRRPPADRAAGDATRQVRVDGRELRIIKELLHHPTLRPRLAELVEYVENDVTRALLVGLSDPGRDAAEVIAQAVEDPRWRRFLLAVEPIEGDATADERAERVFETTLVDLKDRCLKKAAKDIGDALARQDLTPEEEESLLRRKRDLTRRRRALRARPHRGKKP